MSVRRRVLVVDHTAKEGGGELALLRIAELLDGDRADIRALIFESGPFVDRLRSVGIRTAVLPLSAAVNRTARTGLLRPTALVRSLASSLSFVPRLARAVRASGAEVVVANSLKSAVFTAAAAPLAGRRWVWHLHDRLAADYLPAPLVVVLRALAVVGPRTVVVNSLATLATLPRRARARAVLAYPGLPASAFSPAPPAPLEPSAPPEPGAPVVGIIGRISPTKGQIEFLQASAVVARTHPDASFRVVGAALFGEDDYETEARALVERLGLAGRVEFTGWLADPAAALRDLTVLVHASPVAEPFGQVVVEAMAAGVAVVATDAGGVPEILDPGGASAASSDGVRTTELGMLVAPGDVGGLAAAISLSIADPVARSARVDAAREAAGARFAIEGTADAVAEAWRLDPKRTGRADAE